MQSKEHKGLKIVTFDIENSPLGVYTWGLYEQNAISGKVLKGMTVLCASYKWLHEKKVHNIAQIDDPKWKPGIENDRYVIQKLRDILDEADIVVTQNGKSFDVPIIRMRMLLHGIEPWSPFRQVDTKLVAKSLFRFESNSLKYMTHVTGVTQKSDPGGFGTWEGCMSPDRKIALAAYKRMIKYNNIDVLATEDLYLKFRPYMESHPNLAIATNRPDCCKICFNSQLQARGYEYTETSRRRRFQCVGKNGCGTWVNKGPLERVVTAKKK